MVAKSKTTTEAALRFLETGHLDNVHPDTLAAECDGIVRRTTEKSSETAIGLGRDFVARARPHGGILLRTAYRASGWANLVGGKFAQAEKSYLHGRELVKRDAMLRARIDRVLIDVYMYLGDFRQARRRARLSLRTFGKLGANEDLAKTRVNYANLLHRQDRHREAHKLYAAAAKFFERKRAPLAAAFCQHNQANTLVQLFDFGKAAILYRKAEKSFVKHGHDLRAVGCRYGLAWLSMLRGDYHVALEELTYCQNGYEAASQPREVVLCLLDRAEAYLGLNLHPDARRSAQQAEKMARKLGIGYESAKGALFLAKASLGMGRTAEARRALVRAKHIFANEKNNAFLGAVELVSLQADPKPVEHAARIRAARKRFRKTQLPLWEAICDLQILSEYPEDTRTIRRLADNPAVTAVPHLCARFQTMRGDRLARRGQLDDAVACWRRACNVLDKVRAKLPPVDMRTAFLSGGDDPHCRLTAAELKRNPTLAAAWSERRRTAGLWQVNDRLLTTNEVRSRAERSLAELASQVTALSGRLEGAGKRSSAPAAINQAQHALEEKVRHHLARLEKATEAGVDRAETVAQQFVAVARRLPVIQFDTSGAELIAFVHTGNEVRLHRYMNGATIARELMGRWRFLMERAPTQGRRNRADVEDEQRLLQRIGEWLLAPLEIPPGHKRLLILPEGCVADLPWQALAFNGRPLVSEFEIVIAPSLRHYLHARNQKTRSRKIEIFVGSAEGLPPGLKEHHVLAAATSVVTHDPCRRRDWPSSGQARLWHYTGHAEFRRDNPFYSSLQLADGPMFAADFRLRRNTVNLVTLAACRTGQQSFLPGEESTGLVRSFLEMGARNVLASQWAVMDESTALWMNEFYRRWFSGEPTSSAVRKTALDIRNKYPSVFHWAAFNVFGAG